MPNRLKCLSKTAATSLAALALVVAFSSRATAQYTPFFSNMGPFLNREDFTFSDAAVHKLMEPHPAAFGTVVTWANPQSGNSGVLTMGRAYQKDGHDCRIVRWHDAFKQGTQRTFELDTCLISGVWKLM